MVVWTGLFPEAPSKFYNSVIFFFIIILFFVADDWFSLYPISRGFVQS